jgi:alpha-L-rhamnosidase
MNTTKNSRKFLANHLDSDVIKRFEDDKRVRTYVTPRRVVWKSGSDSASVENEKVLLSKRSGQITLDSGNACVLKNGKGRAGILLDYGIELQGGIQILAWSCGERKSVRLRVRFGESVMEAMSELGGEKNATNDHAVRDQIVEVSFMGMTEIGNSGFRFVRIDLLDDDAHVEIKSVRAVFIYKDIEYKGSFRCNDPLLNKIWDTGAYTVHLNMQNYVWDGIKRDRLVWVGDMHPETSTIQTVFGYDDTVPRSLDLIRDETPLPGWMNGIPGYSMWWILIHYGWFRQNGDLEYLYEQKEYLIPLLEYLMEFVEEDGRNTITNRFIDWPSSGDEKAQEAGIHALFAMAMEKGAELCDVIGELSMGNKCRETVENLKRYIPDHGGSKQAAALMVLAGMLDAEKANREVLAVDGARRISTFLGYYVLKARAKAGDIMGALDCIREYWGGMLKLGATTFWEDFNLDWMENASRIDEIVREGMKDIHGDFGNYCYKGYRHSLCHGWASGPTAWLSNVVLGVKIVEPGCKTVRIKPELGDLLWAEGTYPTPFGIMHIRHEKREDGTINSTINAPEEVKILR